MPFDISDPRLRNFFQEEGDIREEEVEGLERDRRNYLTFVEDNAEFSYIGVSVGERSFDEDQLEKTVDTEITELT